jgi:hypothetical protein
MALWGDEGGDSIRGTLHHAAAKWNMLLRLDASSCAPVSVTPIVVA